MEYKKLHASKYHPLPFVVEENLADAFFYSFATTQLKDEFDRASSDEKNEMRAQVARWMLAGDPDNMLVCKARASPVLELPCLTRRKRNGKPVETLRFDFSSKEPLYGQTAQKDNSSNRIEFLGARLSKLEESDQQARSVITNVGAVTRSMKSSIDLLSKKVDQLFRRMDAADEFIKETVDYSQSIASAYAAWRVNERAGRCPARRPASRPK